MGPSQGCYWLDALLTCKIVPPPFTLFPEALSLAAGGAFFIQADGEPPAAPPKHVLKEDDKDGSQSLLALLTEHLSLAGQVVPL
jgi:hypothetical protein